MNKIYVRSQRKLLIKFSLFLSLLLLSASAFSQITIGTGTSTQRYPFTYWYGFGRTASIYNASEMNTVTTGGTITTISWYSTISSTITGPTVIYLKQVGSTSVVASDTWANTIAGATQVYSGTPPAWTVGWNEIDITDYQLPAGQNLEVLVECNFGGGGNGTSTGTAFRYTTSTTSSNAYWQADNNAPTGTPTASTSGAINALRPNVILAGLTPPACSTPTSVTIGSVTATTASVSFTSTGSGFVVEYGATGFTPGTGATAGTGGTVVTGSASPIALSNLTQNTTYQVYVRQNCTSTGNGYSNNSAVTSFTTTALCPTPTGVSVGSITSTSASVSFTSTGSAFVVEYGATGFTPGTGTTAGTGGTVVTGTASPIAITSLTPNTTYQVYVRQNCTAASNGFSGNTSSSSFTTLALPPANDLPSGAITLTVDANCTGAPYTNASGTLSTNEPRISCKGSQTTGATVWFKFVAPPSGFVRVSTDVTGNGLTDTKLGVFSAADTSLASFQIIACDDDNGVVLGNSSIVYVSGLTPGATYYVGVDHYNGTSTGTFCVQVHTMTTAMMATGTCATSGQSVYPLAAYTGQLSMTSSTGLLIANVRATAALGADPSYTPYANVNTAAVRADSLGRYYLDRNFRITNSTAGNYNVQFFFLNSELSALQAVSPGATLASLNSTKVKNESQCNNNLVSGGVANDSLLTQVANGSANGISWVNVVTPGFSNFYLHTGNVPLPITFEYLKGKNAGTGNALNWKVNCTSASVTMVLERSADARKFDYTVTSITASQARCGQPFDATDAAPLKGTNYYRLKMIDVDGKVTYSPVVAILYGKAGAELVGIYPTVVRNEAYLSVTASRTTKMQIAISDMSGKVIRTMTENVVSGSSVLTINTNNIASGVYNITGMLDGVKTQTLRFIKE